jgi:DNA-binding CsgD family transcriptional regulator
VAARPALDPAIAANVIELEGDRIHFAHPLLASVAYAMASETERRGVHRRLAGAVDEPTERARHLAQAAEGPDAAVAVTLERAAETARLRGASAAAAELCEQALALTPPDEIEDVRRRTLIAARYRFVAGDTASARSLLESWLQGARDGGRAEALALLGRLLRYEGDQRGAAEVLRKALAEPAAAEDVRAEAAQGLASTLFFMRDDLELALHYAVVAGELAAASGHAALRQEALVQRGLIEAALGRREGGARLEAAERLVEPARPVQIVGSAQWGRAYFLVWADEPEQAAVIMRRCHDEALSTGDDGSVPMILAGLAFAQYLSGHWQAAATNVEEAYELALQTGQRPQEAYSLSVRALVEASRGAEDRARADAAEALELAGEREMGVARIHALGALGLLHLSLERPADVVQLLAPHRVRLVAAGVAEPGSARFFPDEIEALVELGRLDEARGLLEWFEARAVALDRASALGAAGRCRGLLASALGRQDEALVAFERAIAEHDRVSIPFDRARTLLAHGGALRRAMRKRDARTVLDEALADFDRLGATLYADRTREELGRIGGTTAAAEELTAAEQKVAQLVAQGLTNKEVAAALFVTPKTIEFHLGNVFRKLGVRSRTELARRL